MATLEAERGRGSRTTAFVADRSTSILDSIAVEIRPEEDPELASLLADARAAVEGLQQEAP
jgi:formylmethanofuran dehydrogenase subunit B